MDKVLMVVGPTAVGKSDLAIDLAIEFNGEIISADSIQVYRKLNIGSAKIKESETRGIRHHLIDIKDINEKYSVAEYQKLARSTAKEIIEAGHLPIVVGGTGLYSKAMVYDYVFDEEDSTDKMVEELNIYDVKELYNQLKELDEDSANQIHPNNKKRIIRAIVRSKLGNKKSEAEQRQMHEMVYDCKVIGCTMDRELLYQRCNQRVEMMVEDGLIDEIKGLLELYPDLWDYQSMQGIGYKEWKGYFEGTLTKEETIEIIQKNTRQFVKRQYTWLNHQIPVRWVDVLNHDDVNKMKEEINEWLKMNG